MKKKSQIIYITLFYLSLSICSLFSNPNSIKIELSNALKWDAYQNRTYQLESSTNGSIWNPIGPTYYGNNDQITHEMSSVNPELHYRLIETIPGSSVPETNVSNGDFEVSNLANWSSGGTHAPIRSSSYSKNGTYSARFYLPGGQNESLLNSNKISGIQSGESYSLNFWAKKVDSGPSLLLQYKIQWFGTSQSETGLINFDVESNEWENVNITNLNAPNGANEAAITFRIVTGAVNGAKGDIYIDSLSFNSAQISTPNQTETRTIIPEKVAKITFPSINEIEYSLLESTDLLQWNNTGKKITGDGSSSSFSIPADSLYKFIRVIRPEFELLPPSNPIANISLITNSVNLSWTPSPSPTIKGYRIYYGTNLNQLDQSVQVIGSNSATITGLNNGVEYFFAVVAFDEERESVSSTNLISAIPNQNFTLVPLFSESTILEPATTINNNEALITYIADRGRDRHAREGILTASRYPNNNFNLYDFYLINYWQGRHYSIEVIDRIAKGGDTITLNITTSAELESKDTRMIYLGDTTPAQYSFNFGENGHRDIDLNIINNPSNYNLYYQINDAIINEQGNQFPKKGNNNEYYYSATLSKDYQNRNLKIGDKIEIEFSPFLKDDINYYGTAFLYVIGEGIKPWYGKGRNYDSYALPQSTLLGGFTTQHQQFTSNHFYSFKQMAGNLSPLNAERFMLGRRIHHTNFKNGKHSEFINDSEADYDEFKNKLGLNFINKSCIACHKNNGKGQLPDSLNSNMEDSVVKIGRDALGNIHELFGSVLQTDSIEGSPEGNASISNWINESYSSMNNTYNYNLRRPDYNLPEEIDYFSVRIAPQIWGMGLLEAIDEETILNLQDPNDNNNDGISGRINFSIDSEGNYRMGRFGYKASKYSLKQHIASALNTDMGVATELYPSIDYSAINGEEPYLSSEYLDHLYRYIALLALTPQRDFENPDVIEGEQIFNNISCNSCHIGNIETGPHHPLTELRNQRIRPFTDLLLHDMGEGLEDNMGEENATGREWRTAPLWGIGLVPEVSEGEEHYLHDGRARTIEEAILWHGGEAEASKQSFKALSESERSKLLTFLKSL